MREQGVLLGFVPAVDFIHKQDSAFAVQPAALVAFLMTSRKSATPASTALRLTNSAWVMCEMTLRDGGFAGAGSRP